MTKIPIGGIGENKIPKGMRLYYISVLFGVIDMRKDSPNRDDVIAPSIMQSHRGTSMISIACIILISILPS